MPTKTYINQHPQDLITSLQKCPNIKTLRQIHAHFLKYQNTPPFFLSKLLSFVAISNITYAHQLFDQIPQPKPLFSYNTLIRAYSLLPSPSSQSITLYQELLRSQYPNPNTYTLAFLLKSCSLLPSLAVGRQVHSHAIKLGLSSNTFVETALLTLYAKCEEIPSAKSVFNSIPNTNVISWSAMISGYARVGMVNAALDHFRTMQEENVDPDEVTMVSVISACAKAGALDLGRWVHEFVGRKGIKVDLELSTALIDMYAKCGAIERARKVFDEMGVRDTKAWSSMIVGLAIHGLVGDALDLFSRMLEMKVKPNHVTFIGVLSACAHSGLVSDGRRFWSKMQELGIEPLMEHYGCMVDLLCRDGLFQEAYSFVNNMPISPNSIIWRTLLVGCKNSRDFAKGEIVAERLLELEPLNAENYVLMSNLYALSSMWEKVSYMRKKMKDSGVKVVPGLSTIEIDGFVHEFAVGEDSHPEIKEIRALLRDISERVQSAGHDPLTSSVLHDVGEEEKANALCEHSERLAIAFGMLKTKSPLVIRVVKNLRVCGDCHEVTKIISRVYDREIIVRDRVRFHRFLGGTCSCNDFW